MTTSRLKHKNDRNFLPYHELIRFFELAGCQQVGDVLDSPGQLLQVDVVILVGPSTVRMSSMTKCAQ